jgi:DNA-binding LacI/PurR family transcriptional regulator
LFTGKQDEFTGKLTCVVTLRDVARALGVSHTTVSNAYNRPEKLSEQLRERILETAARMGYQGPDPLAAGLVRRQAGALGVVFDEDLATALSDPAALLFLQGVARAGQASALGLTLLPAPRGDSTVEEIAARSALVDGFVVYSVAADHPGLAAARRRGVPLVVVDEPAPPVAAVGKPAPPLASDGPAPLTGDGSAPPSLDGESDGTVARDAAPSADAWMFLGVDDRGGAEQAARHLLDLGHRRIAILVDRLTPGDRHGPVTRQRLAATTYETDRERLAGYLTALDGSTPPIWECGGGTPEHAAPAAQALLTAAPAKRVTAILAMTDELARGVLKTAAAMGIAVPGELSVIGFDDIPEAARTDPPLTTVHQSLAEKGVLAVEMLTGQRAPGERLPTHLVTRETTAPPPR